MRQELKKLFDHLKRQENNGSDYAFFGSGLEWRIYYIFLCRYDAIRQNFDLPQFGYSIENYFQKDEPCNPYEDIIKPFFKLLRDKNDDTFDHIDLEAYFKNPESLDLLDPSEIKAINKAIDDSGISNFSLDNFSVEEFDSFFIQLIEKTKFKQEKWVWCRVLNKHFAKFISEKIPHQSNCLFVGDETAEIAFRTSSVGNNFVITSNYDSILWYYLRVILTGKWNVKVIQNELAAFIKDEYDFIF